ncbi:MAG TPA: hypothetical protein PK400_11655 [Phycisphaerales bacterium]|nr:hypothetical protein [Phycisphaerales bacterium]
MVGEWMDLTCIGRASKRRNPTSPRLASLRAMRDLLRTPALSAFLDGRRARNATAIGETRLV